MPTAPKKKLPDHEPVPKQYPERIGDQEYWLPEVRLDVSTEVVLWYGNPRLQQTFLDSGASLDGGDLSEFTEEELEARLRRTRGYDPLRKSIEELGQLEPVYVWKQPESDKFLVLEGATRVTILRELALKYQGQPKAERFRYVVAKVLPPEFNAQHRAILLARIHVRGSGVRPWGRYIEAKFIHDHVTPQNGQSPLMSVTELANHMGKSVSWVSRLKDAYEFVLKFVESLDTPDAVKMAIDKFSILEEISKASGFGPKVKDYDNPAHDKLREEVFQMVRNNVFKEYRDARFIAQFHADPEKWGQLLTFEEEIGHRLANEARAGVTGVKGKINTLYAQVERTLDRDREALDEDDLTELKQATTLLESRLCGLGPFRMRLREFIKALQEASLSEIKEVTPRETDDLEEGLKDFRERLEKYNEKYKAQRD